MSYREILGAFSVASFPQTFINQNGDMEHDMETVIQFHPQINEPSDQEAILADLFYGAMVMRPVVKEAIIRALTRLNAEK